ncbi:unnamed protein product [Acanthoscelides obtectus]|uniref:Uncharacterized protein n=1 Tax=Acanthoscelides obtectus TaxID=200917 RepID=A0A9P0PWD3_ACAOB|nr:unnamed protein product [Acanthoscelides obtectus]CAH2002687.1 unnamed protein product [Acanthoscelides obtectus]CAK1664526.1 hypothetical protein AOBTE_LOCUS24313 [Acanthoscelides obtectus]CAK1675386.1 hypothetical protein AOBTE_LOCUS30188 [Acanthoscelides obtectus]
MEQTTNTNRELPRQILKKHGFRSYKYQLHHHLYDDDFLRRFWERWLGLFHLGLLEGEGLCHASYKSVQI